MVKVLFIAPVLEHPAAGGPQLSVETAIKALSIVSELHIISIVPVDSIGGLEAQRFYEEYCANFLYAPSADEFHSNKLLRKLQKMQIRFLNQDINFIIKYFEENSMDVIWCDRSLESSFEFDLIREIKKRRYDIKVVCDTCAVYSRFILRELPYAQSSGRRQEIENAGKKKEEVERILVNLANATTAVSETDAQYFRSIAKVPEKVKLFSNVIDIKSYQQPPPPADNLKKPCIYLAGTFYNPQSPMADAARWVIAEVLPLVRRQIPDLHFYIVGKGSDQIFPDIDDQGITTTGKLPSVLPYLCHADVAIVPLRYESGTRFKILEAGACGIPVVSTTLGAEGISITHEKDILIADEPELFAKSISKLINNREFAFEIAENLKKLVEENHSVTHLAQEARLILDYLMQNSN